MFKTVVCIAGLTMLAGLTFGDDADPALFNDGSTCGALPFCGSSLQGVDPNTGQTTLEYKFNSDIVPNATHYDGLVELVVTSGTHVSDQYLDFYDNAGVAEVFLYCGGAAP